LAHALSLHFIAKTSSYIKKYSHKNMISSLSIFGVMDRFLEGDFESYVRKMRKPHAWGGEPELLMCSYVLR
jgi:hypothetical protein